MLLVLAGSILTFAMVQEATVVEPYEKGVIVIQQDVDSSPVTLRSDVRVEPLVEQKFRNIVRQAYDYSCGSAALTTVLNFYLGRTLSERQVMEGLLHYGESERIVERRAFSMLDMKRLVTALGYPSGASGPPLMTSKTWTTRPSFRFTMPASNTLSYCARSGMGASS